jgi:hypothetical protein
MLINLPSYPCNMMSVTSTRSPKHHILKAPPNYFSMTVREQDSRQQNNQSSCPIH